MGGAPGAMTWASGCWRSTRGGGMADPHVSVANLSFEDLLEVGRPDPRPAWRMSVREALIDGLGEGELAGRLGSRTMLAGPVTSKTAADEAQPPPPRAVPAAAARSDPEEAAELGQPTGQGAGRGAAGCVPAAGRPTTTGRTGSARR